QRPAQDLEGPPAVEVVGVDGAEVPFDLGTGGEHRVPGAPGLLATAGELLLGIAHGDVADRSPLDVVRDRLAAGLRDHEHDLVEAGAHPVVDGVVEQRLTGGAQLGHLLHAAEARADPGGEDDESCAHECSVTPLPAPSARRAPPTTRTTSPPRTRAPGAATRAITYPPKPPPVMRA